MKRTVMKTAFLLCAVFLYTMTHHATAAASADIIALQPGLPGVTNQLALVQQAVSTAATSEQTMSEEPLVKTHTVQSGESLTHIALAYDMTWERLFDKNTKVTSPDIIQVGQVLLIPAPDEKLASRKIPVARSVASVTQSHSAGHAQVRSTPVVMAGPADSRGNRYVPGYCTWYVKNRRPDLPNNLGNAGTWVARARAQGLPTGSKPKVGAVGQSPGHVVYVERVNGDGTILISDMNYKGRYIKTVRTVRASNYQYIY